MAIPKIGARVQVREGPMKGTYGWIEKVKIWKDAMRSLSEAEVRSFALRCRQDLGANWQDIWFEAKVRLESGKIAQQTFGPRDIDIEPSGYRSDPHHSSR